MPDEVDQLCARLENVTKENYAGVEYHCGTLQGKQVVVCCAGMGKANAASTPVKPGVFSVRPTAEPPY